jgi:alcohol dehydrogenase class IV
MKMNSVPPMISTKDLMYLADMFEWFFTASKKAEHFSNEAQDPEVKERLKVVAKMHANHCQTLVNILGGGGNQ